MLHVIRTATVGYSHNVLLKGQLKFLSRYFKVTAISSDEKQLSFVRKRENVYVHKVNMVRQIHVFKDFISLIQLYIVFKRSKPILVHSITPKAGLLSMLAAKFAGVPIRLHTFTGLIFPTRKGIMRIILIFMDRLLCWAATNVYPEGQGVKKDLLQFRITSKPLKVLANGNINGIDIEFYNRTTLSIQSLEDIRRDLEIKLNDFIFIFVGRLVGDKGINELISAFKSINVDSGVKLILVGPFETELDPLLPQTIADIKSNPNIISVGFQEDVRPYFAISDCLVFPSYREGFPNVVMQAGAMELPAIVTDINGCNEIIEDGKNGLIIPPKNVDALRAAMEKIVMDQTLYSQLKEHARPMITSRYEQQVVWNAILEEYNRLLIEKGFK